MFKLGLTGGIGSGKSMVAGAFNALGIVTVDADDVARQVVEPGTRALKDIETRFGKRILLEDGTLNRPALRQIIFDNASERRWLEQLLHPLIRKEIEHQLEQARSAYVILVSPLLLETDQFRLVDRVLVVDVPLETQIERTVRRDNNARDQVERIIAAQMKREERLAKADDIVDNNRPEEAVLPDIRQLHQRYLKLAAGHPMV